VNGKISKNQRDWEDLSLILARKGGGRKERGEKSSLNFKHSFITLEV